MKSKVLLNCVTVELWLVLSDSTFIKKKKTTAANELLSPKNLSNEEFC